jgi:hypothetical protein
MRSIERSSKKIERMRGRTLIGTVLVVAAALMCLGLFLSAEEKWGTGGIGPVSVSAQAGCTFTNNTAITIRDFNTSQPYGTQIAVSGLPTTLPTTGNIVEVTINGFSHTFPDDVAIGLVGPTGVAYMLQDGAGDAPDMVNVTYTLSDTGTSQLPTGTEWGPGTYRPAAYFTGTGFTAPGPATLSNPGPAGSGTATFLSVFGNTNPNGNWTLYVEDFVQGDSGSISGGWSIRFPSSCGAASPTPTATATPTPTGSPTCTPAQLIADPGFEATTSTNQNPNWQSTSTGNGTSLCSTAGCGTGGATAGPRTGSGWLWFDGTGSGAAEVGSASQTVTFPNRGSATLTYFLRIGVVNAPQSTVLRVIVDGNTVQTITEPATAEAAYTQRTVDLSAYADGQAHTIRFDYNRPGGQSVSENWTIDDVALNYTCTNPPVSRADFDRDGRTDLSVFRPSNGNWYINRSTLRISVVNFFTASNIPIPGDYDGDGRTDIAIYQGQTAVEGADFLILLSSTGTIRGVSWGLPGDIPTVGDYNGDGMWDYSVWRPSTGQWFIEFSSGGTLVDFFGQNGDIPFAMDWDGNGVANRAVYRPTEGRWYVARETGIAAQNFLLVDNYGAQVDIPVPADYDGDNRDDVAVFRPSDGTWHIKPANGGAERIFAWGQTGDIPVPGDYDADGSDDAAVFRPSNGNWYLRRSTAGNVVLNWGTNGDVPIPSKYFYHPTLP